MCAKIVNAFGAITKVEELKTFDGKYLEKRISSIYESVDPFPGVAKDPIVSKPHYIYLPINQKHTLKEINLAAEYVETEFTTEYDAAEGSITIENQTYPVIRIKNISDIDLLRKLQLALINHGIDFEKSLSKSPVRAIISIKKFFYLEEYPESVFLDNHEKEKGYFTISKQIGIELFEDITHSVKEQNPHIVFDAAIGTIGRQGLSYPLIRMYSFEMNPELLLFLKKQYEHYIR